MSRVDRGDRRAIDPTAFREAMQELYGPRPNFRTAAAHLGVPRSTLNRLWRGARTVSLANLERLASKLGVSPDWLSFRHGIEPVSGLPPFSLKRERGTETSLAVSHVFPGTPRDPVDYTVPSLKGLYWLARMREVGATLGPANSDPQVGPMADVFGDQWFPPGPVRQHIDHALKIVASEWGRELGRLPRRDREHLLAAWYQVWALTLDAARKVQRPKSAKSQGARRI